MNFERIKEYLRESSNQSRFVLALSLSTVMALAITTPLAVKAFSVNSQNASSEQVIDLKGPSVALLDQAGNTVFVPQAVVPLSGTVASPSKSSTPPVVKRPVKTNPAAPTTSAAQSPPTTTATGDSVTVPISPTETTTGSSTSEKPSTTKDVEEPTTTEDKDTTTVEETETTTDTSTSVAPEPTLSDPPSTAAATVAG